MAGNSKKKIQYQWLILVVVIALLLYLAIQYIIFMYKVIRFCRVWMATVAALNLAHTGYDTSNKDFAQFTHLKQN
jgi:hypothetical protein